MTDERKLIERYAKSRSEAAFEGIVSRYVDLVYSVALRVVSGDPHLAKDVVQTVFIDLARKAERLANDNVVLAGWLCRHTFFVAASRIRTERRRREREREAAQMNTPATELEPDWEKLSAALDEALQRLRPGDRDAVVLRYFEGRDLKQVGAALGLSEDAAQKRVSRALQKLRQAFPKHGLALTAESLGLTLASNAVKGAPFGMAGHVTASALKAGAMGTGLSLTWAKFLFGLETKLVLVSAAVLTAAISISLLQMGAVRAGRSHDAAGARNPEKTVLVQALSRSGNQSRGKIRWDQIESPDYVKYIANLRAIGCPEQTIRDLIIADIYQAYSLRTEAIWPRLENPYWKKQGQTGPNPQQVAKLKELEIEKRRVLKELLGVSIGPQEVVDVVLAQPPHSGRTLWFLPEDKQQAATETLREKGFDERLAANPLSDGRELFDEELQVLAPVLTPSELDLFRLHNSPRAQWLRADIAYFDCTGDEFKALLDMREKAIGPDARDHLTVSREVDMELARELFGEDRARQYERVTDFGYLNARRAAERAGLPDDLADRLGQIVYEARTSVERLIKDTTGSVEDRKQQVESIKNGAENELLTVLGDSSSRAVVAAMRSSLDNTAEMIR